MTTGALSVGDADDGEDTVVDDGGDSTSFGADAEVGELDSSSGPPADDGSSDGSADASSDGGSSSDGGGDDCPNDSTCPVATVIGEVSGDEGSPPIVRVGTEATWVSFQVTEDNDGVTGENVEFTATLTSPVGIDYDLYVYRGPPGADSGCGGSLDQSTSAGAEDVVHMSWGEGGVANGGDDRAWLAAEIVPKAGMCDPLAQWSLTIEGDT
jgi:hypothetical protein